VANIYEWQGSLNGIHLYTEWNISVRGNYISEWHISLCALINEAIKHLSGKHFPVAYISEGQ
jgi:hypothetical protein